MADAGRAPMPYSRNSGLSEPVRLDSRHTSLSQPMRFNSRHATLSQPMRHCRHSPVPADADAPALLHSGHSVLPPIVVLSMPDARHSTVSHVTGGSLSDAGNSAVP